MSLDEWCLHTTPGGASFERITVLQPTADYLVPLPAWLRAAALHIGGDGLKRKQLTVFWWNAAPDGPAPTVPPPPSQRASEPKRSSGAWRAATVIGFNPHTGLFTLKYHSAGTPPRNVAEGCTPLPALLLPAPDAAAASAPGKLNFPPAAVPTHPVLLLELQMEQQQLLQALHQKQQLQELQQQRLQQVPRVNSVLSVQQQELQQQKQQPQLQQHQHQLQLQLWQQLQQHCQLQQQEKQPQLEQSMLLEASNSGAWVQEWLRKRKAAGPSGADSGDSTPVRPGSRAMSPIAGFLLGNSNSASPVNLPVMDVPMGWCGVTAPGGIVGAGLSPSPPQLPQMHPRPYLPLLDGQAASAISSGISSCGGTLDSMQRGDFQRSMRSFGSTADLSGVTSQPSLLHTYCGKAQPVAAAPVGMEAVMLGGEPPLPSAKFLPIATSSAVAAAAAAAATAPPPLIRQGAGVGSWSIPASGGSWQRQPQPQQEPQQQQSPPQSQQQSTATVQVKDGLGVRAAGGITRRSASSNLNADVEEVFNAWSRVDSAWSTHSDGVASQTVPAPRADSGPLPHAISGPFSPQPSAQLPQQPQPQPQPQPQLSQMLPTHSGKPWWFAAEAVPPGAIASLPKRARTMSSENNVSSLCIKSGGNVSSITNNSAVACNYACGGGGDGVSSCSSERHPHDCDWTSLLLEAHLFDSPIPAPAALPGDISVGF
ncbi:hypothetical protein Vretifemale_9103 [Volvox reticuliferus]|uniref:Uncharacterized protein n=1 Tax=Volvox reticuliferus TaxID=1737510 RepID=A0A8J4CHU8_9CHLO|nr:hypothetical protein Vretifemale_9103 [Volvox reticuliferus]